VTVEDFREHAKMINATDRMAWLTWAAVRYTTNRSYEEMPYPAINFVDEPLHTILDLASVKKRIEYTRGSPLAWTNGSPRKVAFLQTLVNSVCGPSPDV
jgi:hypothetical protein